MADVEFKDLTAAEDISTNDILAGQRDLGGGLFASRKFTFGAIGLFLNKVLQYASDLHTTSKTIIGAINEVHDNSTSPALDDLSDVDIDSSTLAVGQTILYNATSGKFENGSASGGSHSYSTTEQVVGTWIDGSTVYEKTISISSVVKDGSWHTVQHSISNLDKAIKIQGIAINSSNEYYAVPSSRPAILDPDVPLAISLIVDRTEIRYMNNWVNNVSELYVTVQYTKSSS